MVSAFNRRPSPVRHRRLFPYTEGVRWVVIAPPIDLSKGQTAAFAALFPEGNSRHVQPLTDVTSRRTTAISNETRGCRRTGFTDRGICA
jgi:hypothetical protein